MFLLSGGDYGPIDSMHFLNLTVNSLSLWQSFLFDPLLCERMINWADTRHYSRCQQVIRVVTECRSSISVEGALKQLRVAGRSCFDMAA
jgi:hypothetical protein